MSDNDAGQIRNTARNSAIYAISTVIGRIAGLVMLPIYTRYLTPADYGAIELLSLAIELTGILIGMRITQAMFRYYILANSQDEKSDVVSTVLITVLASSSIGTLILYLAAGFLSVAIFGNDIYILEFRIFAFTLITNALMAVGLSYIRARRNPVLFVSLNITYLFLQVSLNVIFVVLLDMHVRGVVISALLSGTIMSMGLCIYLVFCEGLHYSHSIARRLIKYVAPLILASLGAFYVAYADKYFLRVFAGLTQVGLYVLAAKISSVLMTVWYSFNLSWSADRLEIVKQDGAREIYRSIFRYLGATSVLLGTGLALFANDFFRVMSDSAFHAAGNIVPVLVLAVTAQIYAMYCNFGIMLNELTRHIAAASWLKVIISTIGYIMLIPYIGALGAAAALLAGNLFELYWINTRAKQYYDMGLQWREQGIMYIAAAVIVVVGMAMPSGEMTYLAMRTLLYCIVLLTVLLVPAWSDRDKALARSMLSRITGQHKQAVK